MLFSMLKDVLGTWTFTKVNDFFEVGSAGSWEDQDWSGIEGLIQNTLACILIE